MTPLTKGLLHWYRNNRILYPWRKTRDPYKIWLSEILLQQTRIPVVLKYYEKILKRFPDLQHLAAADEKDFLALWSGVGYYRRAHAMLACARKIVSDNAGVFPSGTDELLELPGIGKYTAGAIRNVCFNALTPALDGNIRRVLMRLSMKPANLDSFFLKLGSGADSSDFFQSLMELGEQVCLPNPRCAICPVRKYCKADQQGKALEIPAKTKKRQTETFHWYLLMLERNGAHFYTQNSRREFLKQAWIFPDILSRASLNNSALNKQFRDAWGIRLNKFSERKSLTHAVTYRKIHVHILTTKSFHVNGAKGMWLHPKDLESYPTSSITRKTLQHS